ncbi:uncharacterized protein SCHCODRAFT_02671323 [Schizophyllum commune H4-8]|nr:uncharacterized protein SCHCODRAFT_02671323 [Schizophyllum commune H4-8]KAI5888777.1 hypothetical protein SCHCODRAFT_02671323 [Schizophyllum commune H4-8]
MVSSASSWALYNVYHPHIHLWSHSWDGVGADRKSQYACHNVRLKQPTDVALAGGPLFVNNDLFFFVLASFCTFVTISTCFGLYSALCRSLTLTRMYRALLWLQSAQSIGVGIYLLIWLYRETRLQWDALCDLVSGADKVKCETWMGIFVASYTGAIVVLWLCQIYILKLVHKFIAVLREDKSLAQPMAGLEEAASIDEAGHHAPTVQLSLASSEDKDSIDVSAGQRPPSAYECLAAERRRLAAQRKRFAKKSAEYLARKARGLSHGPSPEQEYLRVHGLEIEEVDREIRRH